MRIFVLAMIVAIVSLPGLAAPALAESDPNVISLELGGEGATSWNVTNIKPGDSGNKIVTLLNAGRSDGIVTIWLSEVTAANASGPAMFANYLMLGADSQNLETNLNLPVLMKDFPQSPTSSKYVHVDPLPSGGMATLVWNWELPGKTGNEAQGAGVSFTINYLLEELPSPPVEPEPEPDPEPRPKPEPVEAESDKTPGHSQTVEWVPEGKPSDVKVKIETNGTVQQAAKLADAAGQFTLDIEPGSRITGDGEMSLDRLELILVKETVGDIASVPENLIMLSRVYRLTGYWKGVEASSVNFDPGVIITIAYDPAKLPENALPPFVVRFTSGNLERLKPPPGAVIELGKAQGVADHASYFAVMTEVAPPPLIPAKFVTSGLGIKPAQVVLGQPVRISVGVANQGSVAGTAQLYLVIDGIVRAIKDVTIGPGSTATVEFEVNNMSAGNHNVTIAGLTGSFKIIEASPAPFKSTVNWSLFDLTVAGVLAVWLIAAFFAVRASLRRQRD